MCFVYVCELLCRGNTREGVASAKAERGKDTERHGQGAGGRGVHLPGKKLKNSERNLFFYLDLKKKYRFKNELPPL